MEPVMKSENHLTYVKTPLKPEKWQGNSLIHKEYVDDRVRDLPSVRDEIDRFKAKVRQWYEELKINLKQALDDENKKRELIGEAFGDLNKEVQEFESDIKKIIAGDHKEWEKYKKEVREAIDDEVEKVKKDLKDLLLEELKKDKYKGPKGEGVTDNLKNIGEFLQTNSVENTVEYIKLKGYNWTDRALVNLGYLRDFEHLKARWRGRNDSTHFKSRFLDLRDIRELDPPRYPSVLISPLALLGVSKTSYGIIFSFNEDGYPINFTLSLAKWPGGNEVYEKIIWSVNWFKENEDLGDIIKAHRQALKDIQVLETTVKSQKAKLVEMYNEIQSLTTKVSALATRINKSRSNNISIEGGHD